MVFWNGSLSVNEGERGLFLTSWCGSSSHLSELRYEYLKRVPRVLLLAFVCHSRGPRVISRFKSLGEDIC